MTSWDKINSSSRLSNNTDILISNYFNNSIYNTYIVLTDIWPDVNNAEKEVIKRYEICCKNINVGCITINYHGIINSNNPLNGIHINNIDSKYISCIIILNFKLFIKTHHYTLSILWNPIDFHIKNKYITNTCASDGFISSGSNIVDNFFVNRSNKKIIGCINNTLSGPIMDLTFGNFKCFYIGINWEKHCIKHNFTLIPERINILKLLKHLEKNNYVSIYDQEIDFKKIIHYINYFKENQEEVIKKMKKCRQIFLNNFILDDQLKQLINNIHTIK